MTERSKDTLARRDFLRLLGIGASAISVAAAAACSPAAPSSPTSASAPAKAEPTAAKPAAASTQPAAAAGQSAIKGSPLEVGVLWEEGSPWFAHVKGVGDSLEKDFPGTKITYTFNNTAARPALELRWKANNPPDVDTVYNAADRFAQDYVKEKKIVDLDPSIDQPLANGQKWKDIYVPGVKTFMADPASGHWYGVPTQLTIFVVHYNKKMFDDWGFQPAKTWSEFLDLCGKIKAKGVKPVAVSGPTDVYCGQWWDLLTQRFVGTDGVKNVVFATGKLAENPGFLAAAKEMEKLPKNKYLMDGYEGTDFTATQALFFQGKAAMILMGSWLVTEMKDSIPPDYKIGIAKFPAVPDGKGNQDAFFGTTFAWNIATASKNVPLAVEYLRRFTGPDASKKRVEELGEISPVKGMPAPKELPGIDKLLADAASAEFIFYYYGIIFDKSLWAAWYQPVQALFLNKMDAETMVKTIDENLDKYRANKK